MRYLIYHQREQATTTRWIELARQHLGNQATLYSGTNLFFTQLNANRPDAAKLKWLDGLCYSFNPQVHAFDNSSLVESLPAQGATIQSYKKLAKGKPLAITAIGLKRFSLSAVGPQMDACAGDARQASLLGAGWTLGSLKIVAQAAGATSATYYETTGPRGLMQRAVFPLYHVFADVAEFDGDVVASKCSEPLRVDGLCLRKGNKTRVLVANMTHEPQTVVLNKLNTKVLIKPLDETNAARALHQPEQWRAEKGKRVLTKHGKLSVTLLPYGLMRLDF